MALSFVTGFRSVVVITSAILYTRKVAGSSSAGNMLLHFFSVVLFRIACLDFVLNYFMASCILREIILK